MVSINGHGHDAASLTSDGRPKACTKVRMIANPSPASGGNGFPQPGIEFNTNPARMRIGAAQKNRA
jgi:hypothetical protein